MNPMLGFVLIAATGYFWSSMFKSYKDKKEEESSRFAKIAHVLYEMSQREKYVARITSNTYRIWPQGIVGGVRYDGNISVYITLDSKNYLLKVTEYMYIKDSWRAIGESKTFNPNDFIARSCRALDLPNSIRQSILEGVLGPPKAEPARP